MNELGLFIKAAREQRKITIREAEKLSGISNAYLSQIENGKVQKASHNILLKLSQLYQMPYEVLLIKAGYPVPDYGAAAGDTADERAVLLIVDDDKNDRELIRVYLESDPGTRYTIDEADSGEAALNAVAERVPDCVIIDYNLPDMDGLEVFAKIKKIEAMKASSVIILTGMGNEETAVRAMRMGAVNYLTKEHLSDDSLKWTIRHALKRNKLLQNIRSTARRNVEYKEEVQTSVAAAAREIQDAANRLQENNPRLKDDADLQKIIKTAGGLMGFLEKSGE